MKKLVLFLAILVSMTVFADNEKVQLRQQVQDLEKQVADLKAENEALKKESQICQESTAIAAYFADSTVAVFENKEIQSLESRFTPDQKSKYAIIRLISDAHNKLDLVKTNIKLLESQQKEKGLSDEELINYIGLDIKQDMRGISDQLDEIDKLDTSFLSQAQKQYVKQMSDDYDAIFNKYL